mmetsp:Transcript_24854/g.37041  ORF Transcript_24854/g.37041 Transcript_24854/m.37041 type:complete len:244 (-) Transcript_24854:84-815(-)
MADAPRPMKFLRKLPSRIDSFKRSITRSPRVTFSKTLVTLIVDIPNARLAAPALKQRLYYTFDEMDSFRAERDRAREKMDRATSKAIKQTRQQEYDSFRLSHIRLNSPSPLSKLSASQLELEKIDPKTPLHQERGMAMVVAPPPTANPTSQPIPMVSPDNMGKENKSRRDLPNHNPVKKPPPRSDSPQFHAQFGRERSTKKGIPHRSECNQMSVTQQSNYMPNEPLSAFSWYIDQIQQPTSMH